MQNGREKSSPQGRVSKFGQLYIVHYQLGPSVFSIYYTTRSSLSVKTTVGSIMISTTCADSVISIDVFFFDNYL